MVQAATMVVRKMFLFGLFFSGLFHESGRSKGAQSQRHHMLHARAGFCHHSTFGTRAQ
jgi:hypothetical protein